MKKRYVKGYDQYLKAVKEGMGIYEFEDEIADIDSQTEEKPVTEEPAATEEPATEAEAGDHTEAEQPVVTEEQPPLDFGDEASTPVESVEDITTKLDFITGVADEYKKLIKNGETVDPKIQTKINGAFDAIS